LQTAASPFISPQVDNTTQTLIIKSRIANNEDRLRNLQFIPARVIWGTHQGPVIPVVAVSCVGGQYFAFVAENGKLVAHQKALRLGEMKVCISAGSTVPEGTIKWTPTSFRSL